MPISISRDIYTSQRCFTDFSARRGAACCARPCDACENVGHLPPPSPTGGFWLALLTLCGSTRQMERGEIYFKGEKSVGRIKVVSIFSTSFSACSDLIIS